MKYAVARSLSPSAKGQGGLPDGGRVTGESDSRGETR